MLCYLLNFIFFSKLFSKLQEIVYLGYSKFLKALPISSMPLITLKAWSRVGVLVWLKFVLQLSKLKMGQNYMGQYLDNYPHWV